MSRIKYDRVRYSCDEKHTIVDVERDVSVIYTPLNRRGREELTIKRGKAYFGYSRLADDGVYTNSIICYYNGDVVCGISDYVRKHITSLFDADLFGETRNILRIVSASSYIMDVLAQSEIRAKKRIITRK